MSIDWNDDQVATLRKQWAAGMSAQQISDITPGRTRNAICGKLRRLGIDTSARISAKPTGPTMRRIKSPPIGELAAVNASLSPAQFRKLQELKETTCRWPLGDPRHDSFCFCGGHAPVEVPYCSAHSQFAYQRT